MTLYCKERTPTITFNQNAFSKENGYVFFENGLLAYFHENTVEESRTLVTKNISEPRFYQISLSF